MKKTSPTVLSFTLGQFYEVFSYQHNQDSHMKRISRIVGVAVLFPETGLFCLFSEYHPRPRTLFCQSS